MVSDVTLTYGGPEEVQGKLLERIDVEIAMKLEREQAEAEATKLREEAAKTAQSARDKAKAEADSLVAQAAETVETSTTEASEG